MHIIDLKVNCNVELLQIDGIYLYGGETNFDTIDWDAIEYDICKNISKADNPISMDYLKKVWKTFNTI